MCEQADQPCCCCYVYAILVLYCCLFCFYLMLLPCILVLLCYLACYACFCLTAGQAACLLALWTAAVAVWAACLPCWFCFVLVPQQPMLPCLYLFAANAMQSHFVWQFCNAALFCLDCCSSLFYLLVGLPCIYLFPFFCEPKFKL